MDLQTISNLRASLHEQVGRIVVGQTEALDLMLVSLLSQGHVLLEGPPGTAKTLLVRAFAASLSLDFGRVQFTPDLMPGDVLGTNLFNFQKNEFQLTKGPIFTQLLLADEINRTPPKTQACLLQAMQERLVSIDGTDHDLGKGFMVIATQNPIEQEGTYPLPEAQLDRFLMQVNVDYPEKEAERKILIATTGPEETVAKAVLSAGQLLDAQRLVRHVPVGQSVTDAILELVRQGRPETSDIEDIRRAVAWGPGPRASQALMRAVRARAVVDGRLSPSVDDVLALAHPVLRHRMALTFAARAEGASIGEIIERLQETIA